jgi:hypothetical protein
MAGLKDVNVFCDKICFTIFVYPFANLPMKKILILSLFLSFSSLIYAAGEEVLADPGDPKKDKQPQPTFTLSKGYFSLFNIIPSTQQRPDTSKVVPIALPSTPPAKVSGK